MLALCAVLALLAIDALVPYLNNYLSAGLTLSALLLCVLTFRLVRREFFGPLRELQQWALQIRGGTLSARIDCPRDSDFNELAQDINFIGEMFQSLAREAEEQLVEHTRHITQKTRSLAVLYDVAASINVSRDLDDLLSRFLHTLTDVVGANAAAVRLADEDNTMRLVASVGLSQQAVERERVPPAATCLCLQAADAAGILVQRSMTECEARVGCEFFSDAPDEMAMLIVPLQYRDRTLGAYNLYLPASNLTSMEEMEELFISIGRHLGMAIAKARLDQEAQYLSIVEERTNLANELHDSLAQTLVSIGFQVRILKETLQQEDADNWTQQMQRIERTLEDANREVRTLISHFRGSIDKHGLVPSVKQAVDRFRVESGIQIFLQQEWPDRKLPANYEIQVLRVVQETLSNIRRHSKADTVRVMLSGDANDCYRVLVEDDGIGIEESATEGHAEEHFGLQILHERAKRIGGELSIESEPGEGTRVVLSFNYPPAEESRQARVDLNNSGHQIARSNH
jgi:two-component system nitrate/nitrite sensor histidine kinase NarX